MANSDPALDMIHVFFLSSVESVLFDPPAISPSILGQRSPGVEGSYSSHSGHYHSNLASMLQSQFVELEGPDFQYLPMFCEDTATLVKNRGPYTCFTVVVLVIIVFVQCSFSSRRRRMFNSEHPEILW